MVGGSWPTENDSSGDSRLQPMKNMFDILIRSASESLEHQRVDGRLRHRNWVFVGRVGLDRKGGSHREDARDSERRTGDYSGCSKAVHSDSWPCSAHKRREEGFAMKRVREVSAGFW